MPVDNPSTPELRARVLDFMDRAEQIGSHRLAEYRAPIKIVATVDDTTDLVVRTSIDYNLLDLEALIFMATMMRPMVFLHDEPISLSRLLGAIGREHDSLRVHTRTLSRAFATFQRTMLVGVQTEDRVDAPPSPAWDAVWPNVSVSAVDQPPDDMVDAPMNEDFKFAEIYLNGFVWHSDLQKTADYRAADDAMKDFYRKCAEIRTFHAIPYIDAVAGLINTARADGVDI